MSLPVSKTQLQQLLGESYVDEHWQAALTAVMNEEGDATQASIAVEKLAAVATHRTGLTIKIPTSCPPQLAVTEEQLKDSTKTLKDFHHMIGTPMIVEEILAPKEEIEVDEPRFYFEGGDAAIVAEVRHQIAVECGNIIEIDSDEDEDNLPTLIPCSEIILLCEKLKMACITQSDADTSLELTCQLRKFCGVM